MKKNTIEKQKRFDRHHAVVIGGSMAGLLAARVLSEHFERVTVIERDKLIDVAEPRKGVPQGRHVHALLAGGAAILRTYFPDLYAALAQDGSVPVDTTDIRRYQLGMRVAAVPSPVKTLWQSRPFLEQHVRDALSARNTVQFLDRCSVTRLKTSDERITGVVLQHHSGQQRVEELAASLVVDASGRGSRAPQWLASLGYGQVEETSVKIDVGYASRIYRCPNQLPTDWKVLIVLGAPPDNKRAGVIFPIEGGYWMVTLAGWLRDYPPDDDDGFLEHARSLARQDLYEAIKEAEPITSIAVYRYAANRWRHYDRMSRLPEGFIVMGDAVCAFSPVYGQDIRCLPARTAKRQWKHPYDQLFTTLPKSNRQSDQDSLAVVNRRRLALSRNRRAQIAQHTSFQLVHAPRDSSNRISSTRGSGFLSGLSPAQTSEFAIRAAFGLGCAEQRTLLSPGCAGRTEVRGCSGFTGADASSGRKYHGKEYGLRL